MLHIYDLIGQATRGLERGYNDSSVRCSQTSVTIYRPLMKVDLQSSSFCKFTNSGRYLESNVPRVDSKKLEMTFLILHIL